MNWYKKAIEVSEQGADAYYTDIGHNNFHGHDDDSDEGNFSYMWALINGVIDVEKETKNTVAHPEVDRWFGVDFIYSGRYDSGMKVISIVRPQEGPSQFRQIPQSVQDLLKQKFPEAEDLYIY